MRSAIFAVILCSLSLVTMAQDAPNKFRISGPIKGTEEFTVTRGAAGTVYAGKTNIENQGITFSHSLTLASDGTFQKYELNVGAAGQNQSVAATRDGEQIKMRAQAMGQAMDKAAPFTANAVVMDNGVTAHFQALADRIAGKKNETLMTVVPQRLALVESQLAEAGEETGTLAGKPVRVRKYTFDLGRVHEEFWATVETHQLMRVSVAAQGLEMVREGFTPAAASSTATAAPANVVEREVTFPSGGFAFPATLCLPRDVKVKSPLIVLVHGSGAHDRDESIGPNKPFRDIAHALAAAGIATLRYDKRTFAFGLKLDPKTLTLDQEVTDDAVAALTYAATLPDVDPTRLFVLGHSLGGTMAPFVAQHYPKLRGMILMAAGARRIDQIINDQVRGALKQQGKSEAEIAAAMEQQKAHYDKLQNAPATEMLSGISAGYWRDWLTRDAPGAVKKSTVPVLVLQGGQDFQVLQADFDLLKTAIAGKNDSRAQWFPELNHLFMPGKAERGLADYEAPSHVAPEVTQAMVDWVKKLGDW